MSASDHAVARDADAERIRVQHNTARFFTESRHVAWVALVATVAWGVYGYTQMPKRKDPDIPVRVAAVVCPWPGMSAQRIEQLVTRKLEQKLTENSHLHRRGPGSDYAIESTTLTGVAVVHVQLADTLRDTREDFNDLDLKLRSIVDLPSGAGPIQFFSDFGDTAALMLTVASPKERDVAIELRARMVARAITTVRGNSSGRRASVVVAFPPSIGPDVVQRHRDALGAYLAARDTARDLRPIQGSGFVGVDMETEADDTTLHAAVDDFLRERLGSSAFPPDVWPPTIIRAPEETVERLRTAAGDKYSYRELADLTDLIQRALLTVPEVSKVSRFGVPGEEVLLEYSQERLAAYGLQPAAMEALLRTRDINLAGGTIDAGGATVRVEPSGAFRTADEIGGVVISTSPSGAPVYLRGLVDILRGYEDPLRYLNYYTARDGTGQWQRRRAITLAVYMRQGEQIDAFGHAVDATLAGLLQRLPEDLIVARTSDQPRQVHENVELFMDALYEAVAIVVLVALIGFWEWRSALLMAVSIPITLAMTFGMAFALRTDLQQVSIATLIIALGLLVDDPVVAADAIKRDLGVGHPPVVAAWLGPTKLARAILFATLTNIIAYLPFILLTGSTGEFLYSLPIVMTCALVASRLVSMTFIPLLGYYLLRAPQRGEAPIEERRTRGFTGWYYRLAGASIDHRWLVVGGSLAFLALGVFFKSRLSTAFFPEDVQYLSYVDVRLPNAATFTATNATAERAEHIIREVTEQYEREHPGVDGRRPILKSITTFVGGGGPRFWMSVSPEQQQPNYAQLVLEVTDKFDTPALVGPWQGALSAAIAGARIDVRQLQTNPVEHPIEIHVSGRADVNPLREDDDIRTLRALSEDLKRVLRGSPKVLRVRDDWDDDAFVAHLEVDTDRATVAGVSHRDVAMSSAVALSGRQVATLREGDRQIPVVARLRREERAQVSDIESLYVNAATSAQKVPLGQISSLTYAMEPARIRRREQFRTITVFGYPAAGALPSEGLQAVQAKLRTFEQALPPGYSMTLGGEAAKQQQGFGELARVLAISGAGIFAALVLQFRNAVKPLLVFAAVPYGVVGALGALWVMGVPFGFMAFLGIASLVGVIVSHVIVLFDFIEEMHEHGEPLRLSLLDAGIERLRPVMITVGATVLALFPLAVHGGPLWQPLCYAQIGGLAVATFIELLLVPVLYAIFVLDLKLVHWDTAG